MRFIIAALTSLGSVLRRPSTESIDRSHPSQYVLVFGIALSLILLTSLTFSKSVKQFVFEATHIIPEVETPRARWKVYFPAADLASCQPKACSTSVPQEKIDLSPLRLADPDIFEKTAAPEHKQFWVGTSLSRHEIKRAIEQQAHFLVIGHINASHKIYLNGKIKTERDGKDFIPVTVDVSDALKSNPNKLEISVLVVQDLSSARPFVVDAPLPSGLFTAVGARATRDHFVIWTAVHPAIAGLIALIAALTLLLMWTSTRDRIELLLFAVFAFSIALHQFGVGGYFKFEMNRVIAYRFDSLIRVFSATLGALIGMAFSRTRESINWMIAAIASATASLIFLNDSSREILKFDAVIGTYYVPMCFLLSALAAASQAALLTASPEVQRPQENWRRKQLWMFASINLYIAGVSLFSSRAILSIDIFSLHHISSQLLIVFLLGIFLVVNHRNRLAFLKDESVRAELASQVAHDIRAPLAVLASRIEGSSSTLIDPPVKNALERIETISRELLEVNQAQSRAQLVELVPMHHVLVTAAKLVQEKRIIFPAADIEMNVEGSFEASCIRIAPDNFERCISNILDNSVEAAEDVHPKIRVRFTGEETKIRLTISDNGKGMPRSVLRRVGSRGFSFGKVGRGSGFGLHFVRKCAKQWGSKLEITSTENIGTSVSMLFEKVSVVEHGTEQVVFLENDRSLVEVWNKAAKRAGAKLECFESFKALSTALTRMPSSTTFYIDVDLGSDSPTGIGVAKFLYEKGFKNLYLATGFPASKFQDVSWIKGVVEKSPPWRR